MQISLNHGALLARLKRFDEAEAVYLRALDHDPRSAPLWSHLGVLCAQTARWREAEACCRESLRLDPNYAKAHVNLAYLCLREGRFEEGWAHYEWRPWRSTLDERVDFPRWAGQPLAGKSLLGVHEGGYGDMIQFSRYAAVVKHRGACRITLVAPPALQTLLAAIEGVDDVLSSDAAIARSGWDFWVSLMSLPHLCATRADSIPAAVPYVHADRDAVAHWRHSLPAPGVLVGLVCKGNPKFENDDERSIASLAVLAPLAGVEGVNFVGLQTGEPQAAPAEFASKLLPLGNRIETFADTAAIVDSLDLVICVDTAVAHVAGAMGKPCWVLLPWHMPDGRWLAARTDSPWYPGGMRLFRQPARGDWASVIARVRSSLDEFVAARR